MSTQKQDFTELDIHSMPEENLHAEFDSDQQINDLAKMIH